MENIDPQKMSLSSKSPKRKGAKTIEETYTKKTQLEHILLRPDTYVGSVEKHTQPMWVIDSTTGQVVNRPCTFVPGLYKIFDEIIVNAADNKQRDPTMNRLEVTINPAENMIRVWNNGNGIPVAIHQEHHIYVPELIFGHLLTGSNFDDNEAKTTGGRNGYGAKLANIFSTKFIVETSDKSRKLKFKQEFHDNMRSKSTPIVTTSTSEDYTSITFYPDLQRFKMDFLDDDIVALLSKRVYDIAGTNMSAGPKLNVYLNGIRIDIKSFEQYISLYKGLEPPNMFERVNDRWEIGVGLSDGTFQQVSFVNSICTIKGGCHVNYIADQIANKLVTIVKKRNKGQEVKVNQIKNHLSIYVNALIINPAFDSQTKENLTTKITSFGSTCLVSEKMMKIIEKSGIIDNILNWAKFKQNAELKKKGGSKRSKLIGITKLDDANYAGSNKSRDCTLILTEGDSAKALAISGLSVIGRDYYGVFPLKGKLLNVREASHAQIMKNDEIQNIAKILGLTFGKIYEDITSLRYGHLMIMTDQDHDGSHIKGLLINFLHHFWPSLLHIPGFLQQFITPIVKCTKGNKEKTFFTIPEYLNWKETTRDSNGYKIKYYKGLGTSTSAEAKEYFSNLNIHQIEFLWDNQADDMVDMAFAKKRVDDRKLWLLNMEPGTYINYSLNNNGVTYNEFINQELILFSHADNERSIPHIMDGFKPSQRKVLFSCFKRNLKQEIKVAQLAGYVSEHSAYHHGEASLTQTIIGMAQNFIGSNNINLLTPCGQFGTRLMGGKDAASPRYVFTKLEPITRCLFHPNDDALLTYLDDDGQSIEPTYYVPIIPTVLINGTEGIGTGWSTSVPTYNPKDIINNIRLILAGQTPIEMKPWFRGFIGDIDNRNGNTYTVAGIIDQVNDSTIIIKELPIGKWTTDYKQFLETMVIGNTTTATTNKDDDKVTQPPPQIIKDFKENHTDTTVLFTITLAPEKLTELLNDKNGIYKKFKLESSVSTSNMHLFDRNSQIKKYDNATDILYSFYDVRMEFYEKRKAHLLQKLQNEWEQLDNKVRFISEVIAGRLVVSNRKKKDLMADLQRMKFRPFDNNSKSKGINTTTSTNTTTGISDDDNGDGDGDDHSIDNNTIQSDDNNSNENKSIEVVLDRGYDYLLSMKIWSLTHERIMALTAQRDEKKQELLILEKKTPQMIWLDDLRCLEEALDGFEANLVEANRQETAARKKAAGSKHAQKGGMTNKSGKKTVNKHHDSDDDDEDDDNDTYDDEYDSDDSFGGGGGGGGKKKIKSKSKAVTSKSKKGASADTTATTTSPSTSGTLIPRKIIIEKPSTSTNSEKEIKPKIIKNTIASNVEDDKGDDVNVNVKKGVTKLSKTTTSNKEKKDVYEIHDDDDDDGDSEPRILTLAERLALKKSPTKDEGGGSGGGSGMTSMTDYFPITSTTTTKVTSKANKTTTVPMKKTIVKKDITQKKTKKKQVNSDEDGENDSEEDDNDDSDEDDDEVQVMKVLPSRSARAIAQQKTMKYTIDDSDDEDDEEEADSFIEEDEDGDDWDDDHDDDSFNGDEDDEDDVMNKKLKGSKTITKKATTTTTTNTSNSKPVVSSKVKSPTKPKTVPTKRTKAIIKRSDDDASDSDDIVPKKRQKKVTSPIKKDIVRTTNIAASIKDTAINKAKKPKLVKKSTTTTTNKKKKKSADSDDDDDVFSQDDDSDIEILPSTSSSSSTKQQEQNKSVKDKTPKPSRQRQVKNYATYFEDDDEEDEDEDNEDDEDD